MDAKDKDKLITHRSYLVENVNIDGLLTHLIAKKTINPRTKATIEKAGSIFDQIEALLDVLIRGGPKAYNDFCDSLKENNQDYIVDEISKSEVKSTTVEKDDDEYVKVLAFVDNNRVVEVPIVDKPQSPNKRCVSMPSMSLNKVNGKDTRYALKHFVSVPENASLQDLDEVPTKLTKRDSDDIYKSPEKTTISKKPRLSEESSVQNGYSDQDLTAEMIVKKSTRQFYYAHCREAYKMDLVPRGQALIININQIEGMNSRKGSDIDTANLQSLLQQLHFKVTIFDGPKMTAKIISEKVHEFSQMSEHDSADATVVCFLSHGDDGHIFGSDGERIALSELFSYFDNVNCSSLQDKPKIFIIQACRGDRVDQQTTITRMGDLTPPVDEADGPIPPLIRASSMFAPTKSDMIICYPTQQGYRAWRNREQGSWFVQAIVKVFMQYACCEDICAMMNRVNDVVSQNVSNCFNETSHGTMQMSEFQSSLRQPHLYLFPGIGST